MQRWRVNAEDHGAGTACAGDTSPEPPAQASNMEASDMAYCVRIDRIGKVGVPRSAPRVYEAKDEADAVTIAFYEVDGSKPDHPRVATVTDDAGRMLFTYSGRAETASPT